MSFPGHAENDSGIRVRRDTLVTIEEGQCSPKPENASPTTTVIGPERCTRPKSFPGPSGLSNRINDMLRLDSLSHAERRTEESDTSSLKTLIDFLRNTPPPPGNFMSVPDASDETPEQHRKRLTLWPFRKKSKNREKSEKAPGLIKLPDSAVAGTTIGGYRHIAISIPIEYAHLEPVVHKDAVPPAELPNTVVEEKQVEDEPEMPKIPSRWETPPFPPAGDVLVSPSWGTGDGSIEGLGEESRFGNGRLSSFPVTDSSIDTVA